MRLRRTTFTTICICLVGALWASSAWAKETLVLRHPETRGGTATPLPVESLVGTFAYLGYEANGCEVETLGTLESNSDPVDYIRDESTQGRACEGGVAISGALKTVKLVASEGADRAVVEPVSKFSYSLPGPCVYEFGALEDDHDLHSEFLEYEGEAVGALSAAESKAGCATTLKLPFFLELPTEASGPFADYVEVLKTSPEPLILSALGSELRKGTPVSGFIQVSEPRLGSAVYTDVYVQGELKSNSDATDVITVKKTAKDINSGNEQAFLGYSSGKVKELELAGFSTGSGDLAALGSKLTLELSEHGIYCAYELVDIEAGFPLPGAVVDDTGTAVGLLAPKHSNAECPAMQNFHVLIELNSTRETQENIEAVL